LDIQPIISLLNVSRWYFRIWGLFKLFSLALKKLRNEGDQAMIRVLDYPEYKKKNPEKAMGD